MESYKEKLSSLEKNLSTDFSNGLNENGAAKNAEKYGRNELTKEKGESFLKKVITACKEPMVLILIIAAFITLAVNIIKQFTGGVPEYVECVGIFIAIFMSVAITIMMEGKSEKAFEALNKIKDNVFVKAIRNGNLVLLPQKDIVVGDIIKFETGDKIPVDGRLIETIALSVDESPLTGESLPVKKDAGADFLGNEKVSLAERINMLYSGCYVTSGQGTIVVTAVGDSTEFGKIAKELSAGGNSSTPLQEKMDKLGKKITIAGGLAALLIFIIELVKFLPTASALTGGKIAGEIGQIFVSSIVLIVASVPEGLPTIVAISLALNVIKMAKENALVKKIIASETVGCINVICSDKTGTLTENKMTVTDVMENGSYIKPTTIKNEDLIINFAVNSTANIEKKEDKTYDFIGSSTECALLVSLDKSALNYSDIRERAEVVYLYPFSSDEKSMTTLINKNEKLTAYTKGSPEKIISCCNMSMEEKIKINTSIEKLQKDAKRILAFAHKEIKEISDFEIARDIIEKDMIFDGFVAITDPVREDVYGAVKECSNAGVSIKMLTGDNIITARAIAAELQIVTGENQVYHADDIENMTDEELENIIDNIRVIARSTPTTKLRIVSMLKKRGNVVAVTGDGVNDAPAIKNADVGIAMGITGTEVSKEASDIVLLNDSFTTIVKAIQWGRGIYKNFQRFIQFQLTVNVAAVLTVLVSVIAGSHSPFSALQLLWINIIMDGPPALTLGLEPIDKDLMKHKPTKRDSSIVTKTMFLRIIVNGVFITAVFLAQQYTNFMGVPVEAMSSVLFTMFVLFQLFNAFNAREIGTKSIFVNIANNKSMLVIFGITFALQFVITQFGGNAFNTVALDLITWIKIIGVSFTVIIVGEINKLILRLVKG